MGEEQKTQSSFPPPPSCYYNSYTDEAVSNGSAPGPPPIPSGAYACFGAPLEVNEEILRPLSNQGIQQLYSSDNVDRISEMRKLNFSILANFLDLLNILIQSPNSPKREEKVNDISLLFINLHHLINEYRPHQARETIRVLLDRQQKQRQSAITEMQGHLEKVHDVIATCRPLIARIHEQSARLSSPSAPAAGTSDVKTESTSSPGAAADIGADNHGRSGREEGESVEEAMDTSEAVASGSSLAEQPAVKRERVDGDDDALRQRCSASTLALCDAVDLIA